MIRIHKLAQKVWPATFSGILSADQIAYMMELMYSPDSLKTQFAELSEFIIMKDHGIEAGFAAYQLNYNPEQKVAKLHKIYLLQEFQGSGLGRALIDKVCDIAAKEGCRLVSLNVNRYNIKAINFYKKLNFITTKSEDIDIGNGFLMEDYVMEKQLKE